MDKAMLTNEVSRTIRVPAHDLYQMAKDAHEMRARLSDPRIMPYTKNFYVEMIEHIDGMIKRAGEEER